MSVIKELNFFVGSGHPSGRPPLSEPIDIGLARVRDTTWSKGLDWHWGQLPPDRARVRRVVAVMSHDCSRLGKRIRSLTGRTKHTSLKAGGLALVVSAAKSGSEEHPSR